LDRKGLTLGSIAEEYTNRLYNDLKKYASWWPNTIYEPGDFGLLQGRLFTKRGNIVKDFGIHTDVVPTSPPSVLTYASKNAVECVFKPTANVGAINGIDILKGSMEIKFSGENAIFIYADNAITYSLDDMLGVFDKLYSLYKKTSWKKEYRLITDVVRGGNTTIYISGGKNASVSLDAEVPTSVLGSFGAPLPVNFSTSSIKLGFGSKKNIAFDLESKPGVTPFITTQHINNRFWDGPHWNTLEKKSDGYYVSKSNRSADQEPMEILWFEETP